MSSVGRFLRKIREQLEESQLAMGNKLGVSSTYISLIESGGRRFPTKLTKKLCYVYQLDSRQIGNLKRALWQDAMKEEYCDN